MIYTVVILAYATFSYKRPLKVQIMVGTALVGLAVFITVSAGYPCVYRCTPTNERHF